MSSLGVRYIEKVRLADTEVEAVIALLRELSRRPQKMPEKKQLVRLWSIFISRITTLTMSLPLTKGNNKTTLYNKRIMHPPVSYRIHQGYTNQDVIVYVYNLPHHMKLSPRVRPSWMKGLGKIRRRAVSGTSVSALILANQGY